MKKVKYLLLIQILFFGISCSKKILSVNSITITIHNITVKDYNEIKAYLQNKNINFEEKRFDPKDNTNVKTSIYDWTFTINSPMVVKDWEKITQYIGKPERENTISLNEINISQVYQSASASSEVEFLVKITITEGSKAYYKDTGEEIYLTDIGNNSASFNYPRKEDQEHIDYYVLPPGMGKEERPSHFKRKKLFSPYEETDIPWESGLNKWINKLAPKPSNQTH